MTKKVLWVIIAVLFTICLVAVYNYKVTWTKYLQVKAEIGILEIALKNPSIIEKPIIRYKTIPAKKIVVTKVVEKKVGLTQKEVDEYLELMNYLWDNQETTPPKEVEIRVEKIKEIITELKPMEIDEMNNFLAQMNMMFTIEQGEGVEVEYIGGKETIPMVPVGYKTATEDNRRFLLGADYTNKEDLYLDIQYKFFKNIEWYFGGKVGYNFSDEKDKIRYGVRSAIRF